MRIDLHPPPRPLRRPVDWSARRGCVVGWVELLLILLAIALICAGGYLIGAAR